MTLISLGVVARPFGIKGEIRVKPHNPYTSWFDNAEGVWIKRDEGGEPAYFSVKGARRHKGFILLALDGVQDREGAEELKGAEVVAPESELPRPGEDEYYWYQLIGLLVESEDREIGRVKGLSETAPALDGNDVLLVQGEAGEFMVPFTTDAVTKIDLSQKRIAVNPELVVAPEEK